MTSTVLAELTRTLEDGDDGTVRDLTRAAIGQGIAPGAILDALLAGMAVVGRRFRDREIFLPDVLLSARAMNGATALLKPLLVRDGVASRGRVVLGTVSGDLHDVGKNLVAIMLEGAGYQVVDLGTDVPAARFVDAALEAEAPVIGLSALLTTTMAHMRDVVEEIARRGLTGRLRTIVGGAPVTEDFAREIGADAYARDASAAVDEVRTLMESA
jgi:5-methyltetrahydrofolate--homocysteine methyltransferase